MPIMSRPTIRDVAAAASVSTGTVSKYMNGTQHFSAAVEAKIQAAVNALGYQSNPLARSMITGETKAIGVAILDIRNPHFTGIVKGANRVAVAEGYNLLFVDTEESQHSERALLEAVSRRVDGLIVSSRLPEDSIHWMLQLGKPVVFFGRLSKLKLPSVGSDGYRAAYMMTQHLVRQGHRRIAFLGFSKSLWNGERIRGVTDCLRKYELQLLLYDTEGPSATEGERMCSAILLGPEPPDAVICYNDMVAMGLMSQAQALGFKIPEDVSVTGFDNIPFSRYTNPPLTTIDMHSERMGEEAMRKLLQAIAGQPINDYTMLEPQLVLRASTAPRAKAAP
jgi:DNA-binding LacI/PurR family transcriptional regulator